MSYLPDPSVDSVQHHRDLESMTVSARRCKGYPGNVWALPGTSVS